MKPAIVGALLLAAGALPAAAEPVVDAAAAAMTQDERTERIRLADLMLAESGVAKAMEAMAPQIVALIMKPLVGENNAREAEVHAILTDELENALKVATPAIIEKSRDLYVERFTAAELGELLAFNRTPVGRKANQVMPDIQVQMMAFGQEAGQAAIAVAMPRILDRLRAANIPVPTNS